MSPVFVQGSCPVRRSRPDVGVVWLSSERRSPLITQPQPTPNLPSPPNRSTYRDRPQPVYTRPTLGSKDTVPSHTSDQFRLFLIWDSCSSLAWETEEGLSELVVESGKDLKRFWTEVHLNDKMKKLWCLSLQVSDRQARGVPGDTANTEHLWIALANITILNAPSTDLGHNNTALRLQLHFHSSMSQCPQG